MPGEGGDGRVGVHDIMLQKMGYRGRDVYRGGPEECTSDAETQLGGNEAAEARIRRQSMMDHAIEPKRTCRPPCRTDPWSHPTPR